MNFFKKFKLPFSNNKNINYYTLFTGSHLKYTQEIIQKLSIDNKVETLTQQDPKFMNTL